MLKGEREKVSLEDLDWDYCRPEEDAESYTHITDMLAHEGGVYDHQNTTPIYKQVYQERVGVDLDHSTEEWRVVYVRLRDNKFFEWKYAYCTHINIYDLGEYDEWLVEVFPKTIIKTETIYE